MFTIPTAMLYLFAICGSRTVLPPLTQGRHLAHNRMSGDKASPQHKPSAARPPWQWAAKLLCTLDRRSGIFCTPLHKLPALKSAQFFFLLPQGYISFVKKKCTKEITSVPLDQSTPDLLSQHSLVQQIQPTAPIRYGKSAVPKGKQSRFPSPMPRCHGRHAV